MRLIHALPVLTFALTACTSDTCFDPPSLSDELLPYEDALIADWLLFDGQACVRRVAVDDAQAEPGGVWFAPLTSTVFMTESVAASAGSAVSGARVGSCLSTLDAPSPSEALPPVRSDDHEDPEANASMDEALLCAMGRSAVQWHASAMAVCHPEATIRSEGLWGPRDDEFGGQDFQRAPLEILDMAEFLEPGATFLTDDVRWDGLHRIYALVDDGSPTPTPWLFDWTSGTGTPVTQDAFDGGYELPGIPALPEPFTATASRAIPDTREGWFTVDELIAFQSPGTETDHVICAPLGGNVFRVEGRAAVEITPDNLRISVYDE